jgi:DNA-binding NtrC family response regulator
MTDIKNAFSVYTVVQRQSHATETIKIGTAIQHNDGRGFDIVLQALPLTDRLILRNDGEIEEKENELRSLADRVSEFERATIEQCLMESGGRMSAVLRRLGIPRRTLNEKMARLGIERHQFVQRKKD